MGLRKARITAHPAQLPDCVRRLARHPAVPLQEASREETIAYPMGRD